MKLARSIISLVALAVTMIGFVSPAASADPTGATNYETAIVTCDTLGTVTLAYTASPTTLSSTAKVLGTDLTLVLRSVEIKKTDGDTLVSDETTLSKPGSPVIDQYCSLSFLGNDGLTVTIRDGFLLRGPGAE